MIAIERDARALAGAGRDRRPLARAGSRSSPATRSTVAPRTLIAKAGGAPLRICANLPYNIATRAARPAGSRPSPGRRSIDRLTLMFQREVALRIVATPGRARRLRAPCRAGRLADAGADPVRRAARRLHPAAEGDLERGRTDPARRSPTPATRRLLSAATQAAFGQRRKMLRQSLKAFAAARGLDLAGAARRGRARADHAGGGGRRRGLRGAGASGQIILTAPVDSRKKIKAGGRKTKARPEGKPRPPGRKAKPGRNESKMAFR